MPSEIIILLQDSDLVAIVGDSDVDGRMSKHIII